MRVRLALSLCSLLALSLSAGRALATSYYVTDLGTLGGDFSEALAVNDSGQVVGWAPNSRGYPRAFAWQNGAMADLGTLGGPSSWACGISNSGQVAGYAYTSNPGYHAFLWQSGSPNCDLRAGNASAINESGQVLGCDTDSSYQ